MKYRFLNFLIFFVLFIVPIRFVAAEIKINDVSRLNETVVSDIRKPVSEQDIQTAIQAAVKAGKKISIAGRRHSQGGHIMADDAIVLDMTSYHKIIGLNNDKTLITVQSGTTWAQIQDFLNKENLAVRVQQSSNIFTVGGSLSANVHGRDPRYGPIIETVQSFRLVKADGKIMTVSRIENPDLFHLVIGGYGLFGVISEVVLFVTGNSVLEKSTSTMDCKNYPAYLQKQVLNNDAIELHYARPDITKANFMGVCSVTSYSKIAHHPDALSPLDQESLISTSKWFLDISRKSDWGKDVRWFIQDQLLDTPGKAQVISRNNAMRPPVQFLDYQGIQDTDILQEYFIPIAAASHFMDDLKAIVTTENINILSITLRHVKADHESFLPYAPNETIAFVLYINHGKDAASVERAKNWTRKLINAAQLRGGSYYLTYANYATSEQIRKSYPMLDNFFAKKRQYDPLGLFSNKFYEQYALHATD